MGAFHKMNKMLLVVDTDLIAEMESTGFKVMSKTKDGTIFALDNNLRLQFAEIDKSKYTIINRLTF